MDVVNDFHNEPNQSSDSFAGVYAQGAVTINNKTVKYITYQETTLGFPPPCEFEQISQLGTVPTVNRHSKCAGRQSRETKSRGT